jgi:AraC-like DNA-binding protein
MVRALDTVPSAAVLLTLVEIAYELRAFAGGCQDLARPTLIERLEDCLARDLSPIELCDRFEDYLQDWCAPLRANALGPAVQAWRVAEYIRDHFAERITLKRLAELSDCDARLLARIFTDVVGMSIRAYIAQVRIEAAAARLRRGDKIESVAASVGWRGRSSFFSAFKRRMSFTPSRYQAAWLKRVDNDVPLLRCLETDRHACNGVSGLKMITSDPESVPRWARD